MKIHNTLLLILVTCLNSCVAQKPTTVSASSNIHQFLENAEKNLDFHGTVLLIQGNDTLLHKGYGYSDRKKKIPTNKNTAYNIASVTKGFTAIAILKLVQEGKLSLHDPLTKYFKHVPGNKAAITLHHLLSHTSGIGQNYAAEGEDDMVKAAQKVLKLPLGDSVGKRFIYSNGNYALLGIIIEGITGDTWEAYIKRIILSPLAMNETFFQNKYSEVTNLRVPRMDGKRPSSHGRDYGMVGSTGIFSTAADLAKFQRAISTNEILTDKSKELLLGKYSKIKTLGTNTNSYYTYGFFVTESEASTLESVWLRGSEDAWGTSITFWISKTKTTLIILSNSLTLSNGERPHIYISNEILKTIIN